MKIVVVHVGLRKCEEKKGVQITRRRTGRKEDVKSMARQDKIRHKKSEALRRREILGG